MIITNAATAVLFVIGCYNKALFGLAWWPVELLTLGAFYLLVLLLLFFLFWILAKPVFCVISFTAIVSSYMPLTNIIAPRFSSDFSMHKSDSSALRVMSWNVAQFDVLYNKRSPETRDRMIDLINQYQPDIACFQEFVAGDTLFDLNTPYYRKYSFYSTYEFAEKLGLYNYFYTYDFRDDFLNHQHFGIMIYSRYPIINRQTLSFFPYDYNSNFQYVDIVKGNDTTRVFNIHLQSMKFTDINRSYIDNPSIESKKDLQKTKSVVAKIKAGFLKRKTQSDRIKAAINESPYPVIVCGDFNDVPNSYAYQTIGRGLQNAFAEKGSGLGRTFSSISPTLRIDNIFVSRKYEVKQYTRVEKKLSDHYPIFADISKKTN